MSCLSRSDVRKERSSHVILSLDHLVHVLAVCAFVANHRAYMQLMTMHQAKGREFKVVFLTGWDEGSFPMLPESVVGAGGEHLVERYEHVSL